VTEPPIFEYIGISAPHIYEKGNNLNCNNCNTYLIFSKTIRIFFGMLLKIRLAPNYLDKEMAVLM